MGLFRLFRGELRKIFLSPGIFIMSGLLILVLALAPQFFTPTNKTDTSSNIIVGTNVSERFLRFQEKHLTFADGKYVYQEIENRATIIKELYSVETSPTDVLQTKYTQLHNSRAEFYSAVKSNKTIDEIKLKLTTLYNELTDFKAKYLEYLNKDIPQILVTNAVEEELLFAANNFIAKVENNLNKEDYTFFDELNDHIESNKYTVIIEENITKIKNLEFNKAKLQELYNDYYLGTKLTFTTLYNEAQVFATTKGGSSDGKDIVDIDKHIYNYLGQANNIANILKYGLLDIISQNVSDAKLATYKGDVFDDFNSYEVKENLSKYTYLHKKNYSDSDFANVLAFNQGSNTRTNAYDYMYFVMEIMSFIIIAYCVVLGANMIASEQSSGTMKMLAIRPFKRYKIMLAKILTTLFFALIFMLITTLISFITGIIIYDLNSLPILAIFNAKYVFEIAAPLMYLIYFACVFLKVWIFVMIAFAISTVFKNGILATTLSTLLYVITIILTFVASGANWIKYIITANFDLFKYFGGSFIIKGTTGQALTNLFVSPVFTDTNVLFSAIIVGVLFIGLHLLTYLFFTKRDIQ